MAGRIAADRPRGPAPVRRVLRTDSLIDSTRSIAYYAAPRARAPRARAPRARARAPRCPSEPPRHRHGAPPADSELRAAPPAPGVRARPTCPCLSHRKKALPHDQPPAKDRGSLQCLAFCPCSERAGASASKRSMDLSSSLLSIHARFRFASSSSPLALTTSLHTRNFPRCPPTLSGC